MFIIILYLYRYNVVVVTFPNSTYFMNNNNKTEVPIALKMTSLGNVFYKFHKYFDSNKNIKCLYYLFL